MVVHARNNFRLLNDSLTARMIALAELDPPEAACAAGKAGKAGKAFGVGAAGSAGAAGGAGTAGGAAGAAAAARPFAAGWWGGTGRPSRAVG